LTWRFTRSLIMESCESLTVPNTRVSPLVGTPMGDQLFGLLQFALAAPVQLRAKDDVTLAMSTQTASQASICRKIESRGRAAVGFFMFVLLPARLALTPCRNVPFPGERRRACCRDSSARKVVESFLFPAGLNFKKK